MRTGFLDTKALLRTGFLDTKALLRTLSANEIPSDLPLSRHQLHRVAGAQVLEAALVVG